MEQDFLRNLYNDKYKDEVWRPLVIRPDACSTDRYDDVARLIDNADLKGTLLEVGCGSDGSFDVIIAIAVLEHVVDLFRIVDEMSRLCRPGGHLVVTVPNICYIKNVLALLAGKVPLTGSPNRDIGYWRKNGWDGGHLHNFSKRQLTALLDEAGFDMVAVTGDGYLAKFRRWSTNLVGNLTVLARRRA